MGGEQNIAGREHLMYYRVPGFLAVVWFGSPASPPPSPVSQLSLFLSLLCVPVELSDRREGVGREGANSYDGEKV
jgi:hypothetical protein